MLGARPVAAEAEQWGRPGAGGVGCPALCPSCAAFRGLAAELVFQLTLGWFPAGTGGVSWKEHLRTPADLGALP